MSVKANCGRGLVARMAKTPSEEEWKKWQRIFAGRTPAETSTSPIRCYVREQPGSTILFDQGAPAGASKGAAAAVGSIPDANIPATHLGAIGIIGRRFGRDLHRRIELASQNELGR